MSTQRSVIPWSYSSYGDYQTCPYRFYKVKIVKEYSEPPSEHIIWGNTVHKSIEEYIRDGKPMADTTARFKGVVDRYNALPGETYVEVELACDVNMKPTGFWDADAWCRGKGDIVKVNGNKGFAGDWKTGKVKPNSLQLDLMGVMVMATFPDVDKVTGVFVWLQDQCRQRQFLHGDGVRRQRPESVSHILQSADHVLRRHRLRHPGSGGQRP